MGNEFINWQNRGQSPKGRIIDAETAAAYADRADFRKKRYASIALAIKELKDSGVDISMIPSFSEESSPQDLARVEAAIMQLGTGNTNGASKQAPATSPSQSFKDAASQSAREAAGLPQPEQARIAPDVRPWWERAAEGMKNVTGNETLQRDGAGFSALTPMANGSTRRVAFQPTGAESLQARIKGYEKITPAERAKAIMQIPRTGSSPGEVTARPTMRPDGMGRQTAGEGPIWGGAGINKPEGTSAQPLSGQGAPSDAFNGMLTSNKYNQGVSSLAYARPAVAKPGGTNLTGPASSSGAANQLANQVVNPDGVSKAVSNNLSTVGQMFSTGAPAFSALGPAAAGQIMAGGMVPKTPAASDVSQSVVAAPTIPAATKPAPTFANLGVGSVQALRDSVNTPEPTNLTAEQLKEREIQQTKDFYKMQNQLMSDQRSMSNAFDIAEQKRKEAEMIKRDRQNKTLTRVTDPNLKNLSY